MAGASDAAEATHAVGEASGTVTVRGGPHAWRRPTQHATAVLLRLPPVLLAAALAAIGLAAQVASGMALAPSDPWGVALGSLLVAAGLAWTGWARMVHGRLGNPMSPVAPPHALADEGPYRFGRHPMYLGMGVTVLGAGLVAHAPLVSATALLFFAIVSRVHVPHEEAALNRAFDGWYSDYATSVRRWI